MAWTNGFNLRADLLVRSLFVYRKYEFYIVSYYKQYSPLPFGRP